MPNRDRRRLQGVHWDASKGSTVALQGAQCMTLLLSLRFMSVVFDELRNLSLGLAARSVPWKQLPPGAGLQVWPMPCVHA